MNFGQGDKIKITGARYLVADIGGNNINIYVNIIRAEADVSFLAHLSHSDDLLQLVVVIEHFKLLNF